MEKNEITTFLAPAEEASSSDIEHVFRMIMEAPLLKALFNAAPGAMLVLNHKRQIVFANNGMLSLTGADNLDTLLGYRPGKALRCIHADGSPAGCGTTEFCMTCGAVKAILTSQTGQPDTQECRMLRSPDGEALDLRVLATPLDVFKVPLTIFAITDISDEKRRLALERIFFHDILNTAGGLKGFAELLKDAQEEESSQYKEIIFLLARMIVDEINSQRTLVAAENNDLTIAPKTVRSISLLKETVNLYAYHEVASGRQIVIDPNSKDMEIITDPALLQRVLGNMLKNALEASLTGDVVTAGCKKTELGIEFHVHNPNPMPRDIQMQVFQRSFSTKGKGRGLGTYSIKLITERYLMGTASFSSDDHGTVFSISCPLDIEKK